MNVVLHHNDIDGRGAGAVVRLKYPDALFYEVDHYNPLPIDELPAGCQLFIVDFTPVTEADWKRLTDKVGNIIWIDHHGKNIAKYQYFDKCLDGLRVESKPSGAKLTWQFLFPEIPIPDAILYVSDYDCWVYDYGLATKSFIAGMETIPHQPTDRIWDSLLKTDNAEEMETSTNEVMQKGKIILDYKKQKFRDVIKSNAFVCEFEGHKIVACNHPSANSTLFDSIDRSQYPLVSIFSSNGEKIIVGLYCDDESVDCCELAQKYGGGGHKGASGFECENLPFTNIERIDLVTE
jgi:oligoribonuclease NrnB/cAMP/cGMP phosphodiesterase (DHH superfamily)